MSPKEPTVSVIIPTYNRAHLIGRAIQSVLNQTYQNFEVIVVDDGSTDNTEEIVKGFNDSRICYIRHSENRGASATRNAGIEGAHGEYIAFLDSDDEWLPEKIKRQMQAFERSDPQVGVIYTGAIFVNQHGEAIAGYEAPELRGSVLRELLISNQIRGGGSSVVAKRDHLNRIGGFDEALPACEDWDLWLRLARICQFDFVDAPLVRIYIHGNQITADTDAMARGRERLLRKHRRLFGQDRELLSNWQRYLGSLYCRSGNLRRGRYWFLKSLSTNPLNLRSYLYLGVSLLGTQLYTWLAMLRRRDDPFVRIGDTKGKQSPSMSQQG